MTHDTQLKFEATDCKNAVNNEQNIQQLLTWVCIGTQGPPTSADMSQTISLQAAIYTSTTHGTVSYRPVVSSSRPSTAQPSSPRAVFNSPRPRPASAQQPTNSRMSASSAPVSKDRPHVQPAAHAALQVNSLVHSRGHRSVSPISGGSTGATPSPAQTPCSVLSRPSTAGIILLTLCMWSCQAACMAATVLLL